MITRVDNPRVSNDVASSKEGMFFAHVQATLAEDGHFAFIAGGYALNTCLQAWGHSNFLRQHSFDPSDVDLYITYNDETKFQSMVDAFNDEHPDLIAMERRRFRSYEGGTMSQAIAQVIELEVGLPNDTDAVLVQCLLMWPRQYRSVIHAARAVIAAFDISVCKVAMISSTHCTKFLFDDTSDALDAFTHRFEFTLRPGENHVVANARIVKYSERGFHMYRFLLGTAGGFETTTGYMHPTTI